MNEGEKERKEGGDKEIRTNVYEKKKKRIDEKCMEEKKKEEKLMDEMK